MVFTVPIDHRVKLKESEEKDEYLDLVRELKKLWNMKVTIIQIVIVIGALGTVTEGLVKRLENEWRSFKLLHNWDRPEYWEESWKLEGTCCHSNSSERPSANADVKKSQGVNYNNNDNMSLDLARALKKLWNMKVTAIPIVIGALVTVIKGLVQGLKD